MEWHFKHVNSDHNKRAVDFYDWESALNNDANKLIYVFNSIIMSIINFFQMKFYLMIGGAPRMSSFIKSLIHAKKALFVLKNILCKKFACKNNNMYHLYAFETCKTN